MNTNRVIFLILLILAAGAVYVYMNDTKSTIQEDLSDFAVTDTASISKIFLANRAGQEIVLERENQPDWMVNGQYEVRKDLLDVLLRTIKEVEVKAPIAKNAHNNMVRNMASNAIKVEIYANGSLEKVYYVGSSTKDNLGTNMLLEGSSVPYIVHLPGFHGYLTPRYSTDIYEWRNTEICALRLDDIRSVELKYPQQIENSFRVIRAGKDQYELMAGGQLTPVPEFDPVEIRRYLLNFRKLHFESFEVRDNYDPDSIFAQPILFNLSIETVDGQRITIDAWRLRATKDAVNMDGAPVKWDIDRMHARLNGVNELIFVQYFVFDRVLATPDNFKVDPLLRRDN